MHEKPDPTTGSDDVVTRQTTSAIVEARRRCDRPVQPVWSEPPLRPPRSDSALPLRDDALALLLRLNQVVRERPPMVVFAGVDGSSGVSTATLEVARAAARTSYEPVLVVDANLRQPSLANLAGVPVGPGLADVVRGEVHIDDAIREIEPGSLYLMPAGDVATGASTILAASRCYELLRALRLRFGHVFTDTAPVGKFVDGVLLASQAQYVTLFVKQGRHSRAEVRDLIRELTAVGVRGVGLCLSRPHRRPTG